MPEPVLNQRIRFQGDSSVFEKKVRNLRGAKSMDLTVWSRAAAQFELSHALNGSIASIANFDFVTFQIKESVNGGPPPADTDPLVQKILPASEFDTTVTDETWTDGSKQHFLFELTDAEMAFEGTKWLVIFATTTDTPARTIPLRGCSIVFENLGGKSGVTPPEPVVLESWQKEESDARYWKRSDFELPEEIIFEGGWYP